jgi:MoaF N-terminal domain
MKQYLVIAVLIMHSFHSAAQNKQGEHLLDGTSLDVYFESGSQVHVEFNDGQIISRWVSGPGQNATGQENYRSLKIGEKMYVVNYLKTPSHSFVTSIIDFSQNRLYTSAIRSPGTKDEAIFLEEATIDHVRFSK